MDRIYVIGHVNPDTDAIASAMGYAWLLRERDGLDTLAARAGAVNQQTAWALKRVGLEPPLLLADASPRFESITHQLDSLPPDSPLSAAWSLASRTGGIAPLVSEDGMPFGLINGLSLFNFFEGVIGHRLDLRDQRITDLMSTPCREAADTSVPKFPAHAHIRDLVHRILREEHNDFFVVDDEGRYLGVCHQRGVLNPPRLKLILVDHNEPSQAIAAVDEAELLEILDHHRLGNPYTHQPIRFTVDVVGSTGTLVSELTAEAGLSLPPPLAGLLLAGLLADTLILTSPTTTPRDQEAADRLHRWGAVGNAPLRGETVESFGQNVLAAGAGLANRDPDDVVGTDVKTYEAGGFKFAVAQAEVTDLLQISDHLAGLQAALNAMRDKRGLDFALLLITDVVRGSSRLLLSSTPPPLLDDLPYPPRPDGLLDAPGVVSRKKQLLPAVLGILRSRISWNLFEVSHESIYRQLVELEQRGDRAALCTVVSSSGSTPRHPGSKMLVYSDGTFAGTVGGGDMEHRVIEEARAALADGKPRVLSYSLVDLGRGDPGVCGGTVEVFVEPIVPLPTLVVIGGGHVGKAVAHLAKWLGFRVAVSDDRPEFASKATIPEADDFYPVPLAELSRQLKITPDTYLVLTTRGVGIDVAGLPALLDSPAGYIGVIGSKRRWMTAVKQMREAGVPEERLARVRSPMGLELNAETPEEIAVSIMAEIIMLRNQGTGRPMQD